MGIDMSNYKMIYKEQVFNVLSIVLFFNQNSEEKKVNKPTFIEAAYIDESGEIKTIKDEAWTFQFIRRQAKD